jgi:hypothetical protein
VPSSWGGHGGLELAISSSQGKRARAREVRADAGGVGRLLLTAAVLVGVVAWVMAEVLRRTALEVIGRGSPLNAALLPNLTYRRECLTMPDGGTVALDWPQPDVQNPKAVLILLVRT